MSLSTVEFAARRPPRATDHPSASGTRHSCSNVAAPANCTVGRDYHLDSPAREPGQVDGEDFATWNGTAIYSLPIVREPTSRDTAAVLQVRL